jgi:uncharacterized protein YdaU (DUF1376 family)
MRLGEVIMDIFDYDCDTSHLTALQHGIYLRLLFHVWDYGSLPADEAALRWIAGVSKRQWPQCRPLLDEYFRLGNNKRWRHALGRRPYLVCE